MIVEEQPAIATQNLEDVVDRIAGNDIQLRNGRSDIRSRGDIHRDSVVRAQRLRNVVDCLAKNLAARQERSAVHEILTEATPHDANHMLALGDAWLVAIDEAGQHDVVAQLNLNPITLLHNDLTDAVFRLGEGDFEIRWAPLDASRHSDVCPAGYGTVVRFFIRKAAKLRACVSYAGCDVQLDIVTHQHTMKRIAAVFVMVAALSTANAAPVDVTSGEAQNQQTVWGCNTPDAAAAVADFYSQAKRDAQKESELLQSGKCIGYSAHEHLLLVSEATASNGAQVVEVADPEKTVPNSFLLKTQVRPFDPIADKPAIDGCTTTGGEVDRLVAAPDGTLKLKRFLMTSKCVNGKPRVTFKPLN